jgi:hypothetical protein
LPAGLFLCRLRISPVCRAPALRLDNQACRPEPVDFLPEVVDFLPEVVDFLPEVVDFRQAVVVFRQGGRGVRLQ